MQVAAAAMKDWKPIVWMANLIWAIFIHSFFDFWEVYGCYWLQDYYGNQLRVFSERRNETGGVIIVLCVFSFGVNVQTKNNF